MRKELQDTRSAELRLRVPLVTMIDAAEQRIVAASPGNVSSLCDRRGPGVI